MTTLAILGGGFGLYGYLPAALSLPEMAVVLPRRYQDTLARRTELAPFLPRVDWVADDEAALTAATRLVIARRPADQRALIGRLECYPAIQSVVLEKPLAPTPAESAWIVEQLAAMARPFRVGFTMADLPWAATVRAALAEPAAATPVRVQWHFTAHHVRHALDVWKRWPAEGGGPLRFYGIHLLAALTRDPMPFTVERSVLSGADHRPSPPEAPTAWMAALRTPTGRSVQLEIDTAATTPHFTVTVGEQVVCVQPDPFARPVSADGQDGRVALLADLLAAPITRSDADWSDRTNRLWAAVESAMDPTG